MSEAFRPNHSSALIQIGAVRPLLSSFAVPVLPGEDVDRLASDGIHLFLEPNRLIRFHRFA